MKIRFILFVLVTTILLAGCDGGSTNVTSQGNSNQYVDFNKVKSQTTELMKNYENGLVKAIKENDFSKVEPYILANSPLYESQKKLVSDLHSQGITKNLISYKIFNFYYGEGPTSFKADVVEQIETHDSQNRTTTEDYQCTYTVEAADNQVKLSEFKKWIPTQSNDPNTQASVKSNEQSTAKPDGYYAGIIIDSTYDNALIKKLNNKYDGDLDKLFETNTAKGKNSQVVDSIRNYGTKFSIKRSEVVNRTSSNPYEAEKKITIRYKDSNSNYKDLILYITLVVKENKGNNTTNYNGDASITDVKNIRIR
ncbi:MAG: hypothetical protein Q8936_20930 [Bacillota bacterium]|nr:hypothetical protein [Bacillota bacterium]